MIVILDIHEKFAGALAISATKTSPGGVNIALAGVDLSKHRYIRLDEKGVAHFMTGLPEEVNE